ncbi:hypothetical protein KP509_08G059100 [Ceratopteris richardii]|uniref:Uncharacterized protein n=1 Tax=Ceratopteris richardii TaxID=49495 RepID=A0A8T2UED6_CERRI|nr:hypothetical protein KP509_08G059100 [Ceratopteris richardii]
MSVYRSMKKMGDVKLDITNAREVRDPSSTHYLFHIWTNISAVDLDSAHSKACNDSIYFQAVSSLSLSVYLHCETSLLAMAHDFRR